MLEPFWLEIFKKTPDQMYCAGIVSAHGDKGYSYRSEWENAKIPYHRAMLVYLLTYTSELGKTEKSQSCQWVIDNYWSKYKGTIDKVEEDVLATKYPI